MWSLFSSLTLQLAFQFCLFPLKYVIPSWFLILRHLTCPWCQQGPFLHCSPCVIISFSCSGMWSVVMFFAHLYLCHFYFTMNSSVHVMWGNPIFFTVTDSMWHTHFCWIKDHFHGVISLFKGTFFISVESTCALAQALHTQNAVLEQMLYI